MSHSEEYLWQRWPHIYIWLKKTLKIASSFFYWWQISYRKRANCDIFVCCVFYDFFYYSLQSMHKRFEIFKWHLHQTCPNTIFAFYLTLNGCTFRTWWRLCLKWILFKCCTRYKRYVKHLSIFFVNRYKKMWRYIVLNFNMQAI